MRSFYPTFLIQSFHTHTPRLSKVLQISPRLATISHQPSHLNIKSNFSNFSLSFLDKIFLKFLGRYTQYHHRICILTPSPSLLESWRAQETVTQTDLNQEPIPKCRTPYPGLPSPTSAILINILGSKDPILTRLLLRCLYNLPTYNWGRHITLAL